MSTTQTETRQATDFEEEVLVYLNDLRDSGITNMFGAASYVESMYGIDKVEARRLLSLWMKNFNSEGNYKEVID